MEDESSGSDDALELFGEMDDNAASISLHKLKLSLLTLFSSLSLSLYFPPLSISFNLL